MEKIKMSDKEIFDRVIKILSPYARNKEALDTANGETNILLDLKVNSSRLVDIILAFEDDFDIEIADTDARQVMTIGKAVDMIRTKAA